MNDNKGQNEQNEQDDLRDLDVPEKDAEGVKGGLSEVAVESLTTAVGARPSAPGQAAVADHT